MPNVVDANVNDDQGWPLVENIPFQPKLQVRYFVSADAGSNDLDVAIRVQFCNFPFDDRDVALRANARLRNRISEKYDPALVCQHVLSEKGIAKEKNRRE